MFLLSFFWDTELTTMDFIIVFDPNKNLFDNIDSWNDCKNYDVISFNDAFKIFNKYNLNIFSFNIRNTDEFLVFLDSINMIFDIILVETWVTANTLSLIYIDGYKGFHSIRENKIDEGVSIFI